MTEQQTGMIPYRKADHPLGMPKSMTDDGEIVGYLHQQGALNRKQRRTIRAYLRQMGETVESMTAHLDREAAARQVWEADRMLKEGKWYNRAKRWLRRKVIKK